MFTQSRWIRQILLHVPYKPTVHAPTECLASGTQSGTANRCTTTRRLLHLCWGPTLQSGRSLSWEAKRTIGWLLKNISAFYGTRCLLPCLLVTILSQINSIHILKPHFPKIHLILFSIYVQVFKVISRLRYCMNFSSVLCVLHTSPTPYALI